MTDYGSASSFMTEREEEEEEDEEEDEEHGLRLLACRPV